MNAATWISLVAVIIAAVPLAGRLKMQGERDGKIDAALEQLAALTGDHEQRLRRGGL